MKSPASDESITKKRQQKLPRINMAFQEKNLEYLQIVVRLEQNMSITEYVNKLVKEDRKRRKKEVKRFKEFLTTLPEGT